MRSWRVIANGTYGAAEKLFRMSLHEVRLPRRFQADRASTPSRWIFSTIARTVQFFLIPRQDQSTMRIRSPRSGSSLPLLAVWAAISAPAIAFAWTDPVPEQRHGVAFASFAPLDTDIFIADADGRHARALAADPALDSNASFSPDGRWIIFTSNRGGSSDIYRMRADGSKLEQLTNHRAFDDQGVVSPNGRTLAFVSSRNGQADIWTLDLTTKALRAVTDHPGGDFRPAWSPDGQWIAFSSDRDSKKPRMNFVTLHSTELYVVRIDGSGLRRVTSTAAFAGSPSWSSDGKWLLHYEADVDNVQKITSPRRLRGTTQIAGIHLDTGVRKIFTAGEGEKWSPRWLPDQRIGFVSGGQEGGVEFVAAGKRVRGARGDMRNPAWSRNGKRMLFQRDVPTRWPPLQVWQGLDARFPLLRTGIFPSFSPRGERFVVNDRTAGALHNSILLMNSDGTGRTTLYRDEKRSALAPVWSPGGTRVAFGLGGFFQATAGPSIADIAVIGIDGTGLRLLTDGTGNFGLPSWSPDENHLVYRAAGKDGNGLWIVDVRTGQRSELIRGGGHENFPSWSPQGDRISFTSDQDGDYEIYTIKTDGTDLRRLTHVPGNDAHNAWSPDGQWILFTSSRGGFKDEAALHPYNPQPYGDLYVMRSDGSEVIQITDDQFEEGTPAWVPHQ